MEETSHRLTMTETSVPRAKAWANRFVFAAVLQSLLAVVATAYLLYEGVFGFPAASKIVAGGGAGTWLIVGYFAFLIFGPIGMALAAGMFRQLEAHMGHTAGRWQNRMLWVSIVAYNVGVVGGSFLMMHAGYRGGAAAIPVAQGGFGWTGAQAGLVHTQIMQFYPPYIAAFLGLALLGAFLGVVAYLAVWAPRRLPGRARPVPGQ